MLLHRIGLVLLFLLVLLPGSLPAQSSGGIDRSSSEMRPVLERYSSDRAAVGRRHSVPMSPARRERMRAFYGEWMVVLDGLDFEKMGRDGQVDWILFRSRLRYELSRLDREAKLDGEVAPLLPFRKTIIDLAEARRRLEPVDAKAAAGLLDGLREQAGEAEKVLRSGERDTIATPVANRALERLGRLRKTLGEWFKYSNGYDPAFSWWVGKPYEDADRALDRYAGAVKKRLVKGDLIGDPIGEAALDAELRREMIPYTPAELLSIADAEFAWCQVEMNKAAEELGFDDWRTAQEHVRSLHVEPGKQPGLIADLAREAIAFLDERELVTVPDLCREIWRMEMLSPARQRMSPYFLGGETVRVAFPTDGMSHRDKLMSLRGNNIHFVRAVVHHELIPGHHLQGFMGARHRTYRRTFSTPFYGEGWPLYWELLLYDLGFCRSPEDRIGMLFWRKHRCARIKFSLSYHLGLMSAGECVEYLIENVGHERNNARAEVRRSVSGGYGPLYQAAYMLGGLQLRGLRRELVETGKMTHREFHDAVLMQNSIPVEMVRAALTDQKLSRDFESSWRFYEVPEVK